MDFSLIVPCYNEAENVEYFFWSACRCLEKTNYNCEIIFVDDGSSDGTFDVIRQQIANYRSNKEESEASGNISFRVIELSRNFGKESALYAGLEKSTGQYVCFIDADMQQDPETAVLMLDLLIREPEYDCIAAVPEKRKDPFPIRILKGGFYKVFNQLSDIKLLEDVSDFRVFTRQVADTLLSMHESYRFSKGLFSWIGFKTKVISYTVHDRHSGKSKWSVRKLFSYSWNGVLAFSTVPLKIIMVLGVVLAFCSLCLFAYYAYQKIAFNDDVSATMILINVVLLLSGVQMLILGVLGEYMARGYIESKRRPIYIERNEYCSNAQAGSSKDAAVFLEPLNFKKSSLAVVPQSYGQIVWDNYQDKRTPDSESLYSHSFDSPKSSTVLIGSVYQNANSSQKPLLVLKED